MAKKRRDGLRLRNGIWQISYTNETTGERDQVSSGTTIKELAKRKRDQLVADSWKQKHLGIAPEITVIELYEWARKNVWPLAEKVNLEYCLKPTIDYFGAMQVSHIGVETIEGFRALRIKEGRSQSTVNRNLTYINTACNAAVRAKKITSNPFKQVKDYSERKFRRTIFLDQREEEVILRASSGDLHLIIALALRTGMRQGEILDLKWSGVSFERMQISTGSDKGGEYHSRTIPLYPDALRILTSLPHKGEYVFAYEDGSRLSRSGVVSSSYRNLVLSLIPQSQKFSDFTFHDLRHTFASAFLMRGGSLRALADILGHSTTIMSERYGHLSKEHLMVQMNLLPRLNGLKIGDESVTRNEGQFDNMSKTTANQ